MFTRTKAYRPLIAIIAAFSALPALAQNNPTGDPIPGSVELESKPIRIDELNLNITLPVDSVVSTTSFGGKANVGVGFPDQIGVMNIRELKVDDPNLDLAQITQRFINQLTRFGNSTTGELIDQEENLKVNFHEGKRFYVRIPGIDNKPASVKGMTIFQSRPQRYIVFDLTTLARDFTKCRPIYETTVGNMDLGNPTDEDVRRAAAIKRMIEFIDRRGFEEIQKVTTGRSTDRWERLYLPAATGDDMDATEYGYRRTRSWTGYKGDLSDKPQSKWNDDDRTLGYLVQIDAMALEDDMRVDTRATFYTSIDGEEESWTIKMSLRQGTEHGTSTITGARSKNNLVILTDSSQSGPVKTTPLIQGDGYVSQALSYLVSPLLAQFAEPGEYASYAYNSSASAITLRWDEVEHPEESPDLVRVTTKSSPDTPPTVSLYNSSGELLRVRLSNGRIWEPIELDRLVSLWRKKGLPLN